jgi:hypothetical protein
MTVEQLNELITQNYGGPFDVRNFFIDKTYQLATAIGAEIVDGEVQYNPDQVYVRPGKRNHTIERVLSRVDFIEINEEGIVCRGFAGAKKYTFEYIFRTVQIGEDKYLVVNYASLVTMERRIDQGMDPKLARFLSSAESYYIYIEPDTEPEPVVEAGIDINNLGESVVVESLCTVNGEPLTSTDSKFYAQLMVESTGKMNEIDIRMDPISEELYQEPVTLSKAYDKPATRHLPSFYKTFKIRAHVRRKDTREIVSSSELVDVSFSK